MYVIKNGELYHHGVKGMKWGVRRERAKRARMGGRLSKRITSWDNYISYRERLKQKNSTRGKSNSKIDEQLSTANKTRKILTKLRDKTISDLTEKEINAGKRFAIVAPSLFGAAGALVDEIITDNYIKKNT